MGKNKVEKVMKKLCVCTLSVVIGMLLIQIMPVSAASKTGMGKITNKINKAGYNLWGGYDSPEEAATYDIDFYDSGINAGVAVGGNISLKYNDSYDYGDNLKYNWQIVNGNDSYCDGGISRSEDCKDYRKIHRRCNSPIKYHNR